MDLSENPKAWGIRILFILMAITLISRLFYLQLVNDRYKAMANDQAIFRKVVYPARGNILDRKGRPLLENKVSFDLNVTISKIPENFDSASFCQIMGISTQRFAELLDKVRKKEGPGKPGIFWSELTPELSARLQENMFRFPGFELQERSIRNYPLKIAGLLLGYISEVSENMLQNQRYASYNQGDYVGASGLENVYEEILRGQRGVQYLVRDVMNRPQSAYKNGAMDTPAIGGKSIDLYMDADLQQLGEDLMKDKMGAVIAVDPKTGGILAMVSSPTFDPNLLTGPNKGRNYLALNKLATRPLFNKATQATYPPGSTFKPITALVGLDVGAITPSFGYPCSGGYYACGRRIGCTHSGGGHARDLETALANSCNSYFCDVFRRAVDAKKWPGGVHEGVQRWHDYLYNFGMDHPLGTDITSEGTGFIPDSSYFDDTYGPRGWNSCTMVFVGMGQGEVTLTPLQMVNNVCLIANKGYYYTPHFVKSIGGNASDPLLNKFHQKHEVTHIAPSSYDAVIAGMEKVVTQGTGTVARLPGINVCAKTGTVENYAVLDGKKTKLDNHSVFICFAPKENPKIAIAVVVQNGGYGATWAGPIASLMMERYLTGKIARPGMVEHLESTNLIRSYMYKIDSIQRARDLLRWNLKVGNQRLRDSVRKVQDTLLVNRLMTGFFHRKAVE